MRDYFKNIEIDPDDGYIDFIGPAKPTSPHRLLKGRVKLSLERSVKIRSMTVKFKGSSRVCLHAAGDLVVDIQTMLLPKIKSSLFDNKSTTLGAGDHVIPWELQIPNVYPRSLLIKRASVNYKVELTITIGMGLQKKTVTTEHPIVLQRHLLPCKELSPLVGTRVYRYTVPGKFHYEVDCPRIISLDQGDIPFTVKYLCIADQKPVKCIRTQILQVREYFQIRS
ncbi:hypothetical protein BCR43DRAFT_382076 [Syncephalastrum racemosum]|uniref:Arrestin-like N-terminal domain-containing protein n=1 Tax=Syncephalastrum racemosum TaxID=13706 RepID=A0A1X2H5B3_SYNRA|nr:hypothetical protein BCR43DRAFT_382076 [Syncephalastrum racemosum]